MNAACLCKSSNVCLFPFWIPQRCSATQSGLNVHVNLSWSLKQISFCLQISFTTIDDWARNFPAISYDGYSNNRSLINFSAALKSFRVVTLRQFFSVSCGAPFHASISAESISFDLFKLKLKTNLFWAHWRQRSICSYGQLTHNCTLWP